MPFAKKAPALKARAIMGSSPSASPDIACSSLPREKRAACRRQEADQLQRQWLSTLAWGNPTTTPEDAARIQLWLGVFLMILLRSCSVVLRGLDL